MTRYSVRYDCQTIVCWDLEDARSEYERLKPEAIKNNYYIALVETIETILSDHNYYIRDLNK